MLITGANSPASLSQMTMSTTRCRTMSQMGAESPPAIRSSRPTIVRAPMSSLRSSKSRPPLVMPGCRISKNFEAGSQEYPYVPCPHCEHMQVLEWDNMLAALDPANPEDAHFTCEALRRDDRRTPPPADARRFEWRRAQSCSQARTSVILDLVRLFLSAIMGAHRTGMAEGHAAIRRPKKRLSMIRPASLRAHGEARPWEDLRDRAAESHYVRGNVPAGAVLLMLGIDCQGDRVEWQLVGFGREYRRYVIDYGIVDRHISDPDCQRNLDLVLAKQWNNAAGKSLGVDLTAIDGNAWTEDVWSFARRHPSSK